MGSEVVNRNLNKEREITPEYMDFVRICRQAKCDASNPKLFNMCLFYSSEIKMLELKKALILSGLRLYEAEFIKYKNGHLAYLDYRKEVADQVSNFILDNNFQSEM